MLCKGTAFGAVEFDAEGALASLPVVIDADVFDIHASGRQDGGDDGDGAGTVLDVDGEGILGVHQSVGIGKGLPELAAFLEKIVDRRDIAVLQGHLDVFQIFDVTVQHGDAGFAVRTEDLFPHHGGGTGDAGDVLKSACGETPHGVIRAVGVVHQVHKGCSHQVRQVADSREGPVMFLCFYHLGIRVKAPDDLLHTPGAFRRRSRRRAHHIEDVFQHQGVRVLITGLFGAGHGMPADKHAFHPKLVHDPQDGSLCAADIRDEGAFLQNGFDRDR